MKAFFRLCNWLTRINHGNKYQYNIYHWDSNIKWKLIFKDQVHHSLWDYSVSFCVWRLKLSAAQLHLSQPALRFCFWVTGLIWALQVSGPRELSRTPEREFSPFWTRCRYVGLLTSAFFTAPVCVCVCVYVHTRMCVCVCHILCSTRFSFLLYVTRNEGVEKSIHLICHWKIYTAGIYPHIFLPQWNK